MKRSTLLLITCILASVHTVVLCFLGMTFLKLCLYSVLPMILLWVGYAKYKPTCVLISAIIYYIFCMVYMKFTIFIFNAPLIIMSIISYIIMMKGKIDVKTKETV